jgi:hypothetical protein
MRTRFLIGCGLLGLLAAALAWFLWPFAPKHRIDREGYALLRLGMTEQEVESILGVPPGDYGPGKGEIVDYGRFTMLIYSIKTDPNAKKWLAGSFAITVCFDDQGLVRGLGADEVYRPYDSPPEMICQNLRLSAKKPYPPGSLNEFLHLIESVVP